MQKIILYTAFGWLTATGLLHFVIDVVSQHLRGKHPPGIETTLYYGLHSAYALGQVAFGLLALLLVWRAPGIISQTPALVVAMLAGIGLLAISVLFMSYTEPRFMAGVFCALVLAAFLTR